MNCLLITTTYALFAVQPGQVEPSHAKKGPAASAESLDFDDACAAARKADKLVAIYFYTTWCPYCRKLESTTLGDERVGRWLQDHTVMTRINAQKNQALAARYRAESFPTLVFANGYGREIARIDGYVSADDFLREAWRALEKSRRSGSSKFEDDADTSPVARIRRADELIRVSRPADALTDLLWCYDHGAEHDSAFTGSRRSELVARIAQFAAQYPPALEALRVRRDALRRRVLANDATFYDVLDFSIINKHLREPTDTLAVYEKLSASHPDSPIVEQLRERVFEQLIEVRRYGEIARAADIRAKVGRILERFNITMTRTVMDVPEQQREAFRNDQRRMTAIELGSYYEVLVGIGDEQLAGEVADAVLRVLPGAETYHLLAVRGMRTGRIRFQDVNHAIKAWEMSDRRRAEFACTLARAHWSREERVEARTVIREAVERAANDDERTFIRKCAAEIEGSMEGP